MYDVRKVTSHSDPLMSTSGNAVPHFRIFFAFTIQFFLRLKYDNYILETLKWLIAAQKDPNLIVV